MSGLDSSSEASNPSPTLTSSTTESGKVQCISAGTNRKSSYYMALAFCVQARAKCHSQVGCIIVRDERIIATGYNGTPSGIENSGKRRRRPVRSLQTRESSKMILPKATTVVFVFMLNKML